jgi:hypothetical protein
MWSLCSKIRKTQRGDLIMSNVFVYWDDIYTNGKGMYCTEQYLINNFAKVKETLEGGGKLYADKYTDDIYTKVENTWEVLKGKTIRCNYAQIFKDDDSLLLCNNIADVDSSIWDNVEGGELFEYFNEDGDEITWEEYAKSTGLVESNRRDIYQYYLINDSLAHMLIEHTDNIIMYSDKLDLYVLGVTHFGTGWSCVAEDFVW